jgi:signal transduction histidine kinase
MKPRAPSLARTDWLIAHLRWIVLGCGAVVALAVPDAVAAQRGPGLALAVLGVGAAYNLVVVGMLLVRLASRQLSLATILLDSLLAAAVYFAAGEPASPLLWLGVLPAIAAALRFGWAAGLLVSAGIVLADAALALTFVPGDWLASAVPLGSGVFLAGAAVMTGLVSDSRRASLPARAERREVAPAPSLDGRNRSAARDQARAIYEMASLVSASFDYQRVLDVALDVSVQGMQDFGPDAASMVSAVLLYRSDQLHVAAARRLTPADLKVILNGESGVLAAAAETGNPQTTAAPFQDPELSLFVGFRVCRALMCLPLRAGLENYGMFLFGHPRPDYFGPDQQQLIEAVVNQAVIALQNARLYQRLLDEKERIVEVQEEARKKLARDLHDGPTQSVAAIAMRVNFARRLVERDPKQAADELFKIEDLARRTTKEIRHMLFTLRPLILESQGLSAALQQLAEKMHDTHNQNVIVEAEPGAEASLELNQQGVLFYIVEEAVNNARKHAEAAHIWVRLKLKGDIFVLEIEDDGVGFNVGAVDASYEQRGSLGMVNMRERAALVSGLFHLESQEGKGTHITIAVPLTEEARDRLRV